MSSLVLFHAIDKWDFVGLCRLIKGGIDLDVCYKSGTSALQFSANLHQSTIFALLLNSHATPSIQNQTDGTTPLHSICQYNEAMSRETAKMLDLLFDNHVDVDIQDHSGNTPLHKAAGNISCLYVKKLLENDADFRIMNKIYRQPLYYAICNGAEYTISMLLDAGSDINQLDHNGDTMLHEFTKANDHGKRGRCWICCLSNLLMSIYKTNIFPVSRGHSP